MNLNPIKIQSKSTILNEERQLDKLRYLKEQESLDKQTVSIHWDLIPGLDGQEVK